LVVSLALLKLILLFPKLFSLCQRLISRWLLQKSTRQFPQFFPGLPLSSPRLRMTSRKD